jgi:hypothetical protein
VDWSTVISTVVGVIAGGLINVYFSWRGSKELRREASELRQETNNLRRLTIMLMRLLDQANLIPVKWDEKSNPLMIVGTQTELQWRVEADEGDAKNR